MSMPAQDNSQCVVLVPVGGHIDPACEDGLRQLETQGYTVRRVRGFPQVDVARCQIATDALADGFDELLWIDSDVAFDPAAVARLRSHRLPIVCGIYAKKSRREFACSFLPGTERITFGPEGRLVEILYAGFGFVLTHRSVYEKIERQLQLPRCNQNFAQLLVPYFMPMIIPQAAGNWYLGEDYAFCERARQCGYQVMVDTSIRLWHMGSYQFSWEDAGSDKQRFATYTFHTGLKPANPPESH